MKSEEEIKYYITNDVDDDQQDSFEQIGNEPLHEAEEEEAWSFSPQLLHVDRDEEAFDPEVDQDELNKKREAVLGEHQRKVNEALVVKRVVLDELEPKALKAKEVIGEGDTTFGSAAKDY